MSVWFTGIVSGKRKRDAYEIRTLALATFNHGRRKGDLLLKLMRPVSAVVCYKTRHVFED